jgi:hypothetical protein
MGAAPAQISVGAGGTQVLALDACSASRGGVLLLLGSASGTSPGIAAGALTISLNPDAYFAYTPANP